MDLVKEIIKNRIKYQYIKGYHNIWEGNVGVLRDGANSSYISMIIKKKNQAIVEGSLKNRIFGK